MILSIRNSKNQTINLFEDEKVYQVISVSGLDPVKGQINTDTIVGVDGTRFNSARLNNRNIVIQLKINGDADTNRNDLYTKLPVKEKVLLTITTNRTVTIEGYIEYINCDIFAKKQIAQISIICPDPYFRGSSSYITGTAGRTSVVFGDTNPGEAPSGFSLSFRFQGDSTGFSVTAGGESLQFSCTLSDPNSININTTSKDATALIQIGNDYEVISLIPYIIIGSVFPKIPSGLFVVSVSVTGTDINMDSGASIIYTPLYGGL